MVEQFKTLYKDDQIHIEEILSSAYENGQIYNQDHDEWVMIISGFARIRIKDEIINLFEDDSLMIKAHDEHQVIKCSEGCHWLAVHFTK